MGGGTFKSKREDSMTYYTGSPDLYVVKFRDGKVQKHGRGISFWYWQATSTIIELPATSVLMPFIFNEATINFQAVTLQGTAQYRVVAPLVANESFDFRKKSRRGAGGDGPEKLSLVVANLIQSHARAIISKMDLESVLTDVGSLSKRVVEKATADDILNSVGVKLEGVHFSEARAQPDVQKALQTEYREKVQKQADQAIYERRAAAVQNEKLIKQSELSTEIELADRRKQLVETEASNTIRIAKAEAEAAQLKLAAFKGVAPATMASLALKDWAEKGGNISNLTLTGDMLTEIVSALGVKSK
jgi:regulator of protease activity HflC (stomatin/prohibitin superfamily)